MFPFFQVPALLSTPVNPTQTNAPLLQQIGNSSPAPGLIEQQTAEPEYLSLGMQEIMREENDKAKPFKVSGWDKETQRWFPHQSLEDGAPTLGYGQKLDTVTKEELQRLKTEGITDEESQQFVRNKIQNDYKELSEIAGTDLTSFLNKNQIAALLSYWYNAGWSEHPKLKKALKAQNPEGILEQMNAKTYVKDGKRIESVGLAKRRAREKKLWNKPL